MSLEKLKEIIRKETEGANPNDFKGDNWNLLSQAEQDVFQLELEDMPKLVAVYSAWEQLVGIVVEGIAGDEALCSAIRQPP